MKIISKIHVQQFSLEITNIEKHREKKYIMLSQCDHFKRNDRKIVATYICINQEFGSIGIRWVQSDRSEEEQLRYVKVY